MSRWSRKTIMALGALSAVGATTGVAFTLGSVGSHTDTYAECPGGTRTPANGPEVCVDKFSYHGKLMAHDEWEAEYAKVKTGAATTSGDTVYLFDTVPELDAFQKARLDAFHKAQD